MAIRSTPPSASGPPGGRLVFKPRASVYKFQAYFPIILGGLVAVVALGGGVGWLFRAALPMWWMIPLFMAFPALSIGAGAIYARRLTRSRVVVDDDRLMLLQGNEVEASIPWSQITRLTVRKDREEDVFEVWLRDQPVRLPAAFFEHSDQLLQAVSARTRRPWERGRPRPGGPG
ncbi:MAG: hypothetical protein VKQ33_13765 [Candidatus Sericytochromatia bacterium]|nr:hypothetical protein [Candidatus Sericytochromatia bacterium]